VTTPRDVVIVGAGIIGCAVAYELARRGASVEVVEMRKPGMGATHASAGVLAPYLEAEEGSVLLELGIRSLALYDDFIAGVSAASGVAVTYQRCGTLETAASPEAMERLSATAEALARRGVTAELVTAAAVRSEEPQLAPDVTGGLLIPMHGFVGAFELTRALGIAVRHQGAEMIEGSRARRITRSGVDLTVETDHGSLSAGAVVVAAGSWAGQIEIEGVTVSVPVRPVRGQLLHLSWSGVPLRRVTWGERCYLVPWTDGTLLVGATTEEAGFNEATTVAGVSDLLHAACDLVPHAWTAGFLGARAGLRPATEDGLPVIGASQELANLWYATGHYRNGILLAPLTAQLVADAVLSDRVDEALEPLSPHRFGGL
jgi:glycine oxidase